MRHLLHVGWYLAFDTMWHHSFREHWRERRYWVMIDLIRHNELMAGSAAYVNLGPVAISIFVSGWWAEGIVGVAEPSTDREAKDSTAVLDKVDLRICDATTLAETLLAQLTRIAGRL